MRFRHLGRGLAPGIIVLGVILAAAVELRAGKGVFQSNFGLSFVQVEGPPCPLNQFPDLVASVPIPFPLPGEPFSVMLVCEANVLKNGKPRSRAKFGVVAELVVIDNTSGVIERMPVGKGKIKTGPDGAASFEFPVFCDVCVSLTESDRLDVVLVTLDPKRKLKAHEVAWRCAVHQFTPVD